MEDMVRIGMVGTSGYAERLLDTLISHYQAQVAAICGRNQERASDLACKFGSPKIGWRAAATAVWPSHARVAMSARPLDRGQ